MNKKGFTLVELLLVIVILGIITALTMPEFISAISASESRKQDHLQTLIKQELDMLNKDVGEYDFWYDGNNNEIETCTIEDTSETDRCIAIIKTTDTGEITEHDYAKRIKQDLDLDNCKIENVYIYEHGKHKVELDCPN